jgi:Tol biopolymer transport system component
LRRLTHLGTATAPAWSPDGRTIVFSSLRRSVCTPGGYARFEAPLLRVNSDGTHLRSVTHVHAVTCVGGNEERIAHSVRGEIDLPGSFSPDGVHLVFAHERIIGLYEQSSIEVIRSDGSEPRQVTASGSDPAYSPDGRRIAFVSKRDRNGVIRTGEDASDYANELYVIGSDGANPRRLTHTSELSELSPSWSADGSRIAYARRGESFAVSLFEVNADGSCSRAIARDPRGEVWYAEPAWRPARAGGGEGALRC